MNTDIDQFLVVSAVVVVWGCPPGLVRLLIVKAYYARSVIGGMFMLN